MTTPARARTAWMVWLVAMLVLAGGLTLRVLNGSFSADLAFAPLAIAMVLGYSTVGAVLSSRNPGNPLGWLMLFVGLAFMLSGLRDEYTTYAYQTNPGSLPFGPEVAAAGNNFWLPTIAALTLLVLLFPTGRVPGPRWRYLPPAILGCALLSFLGMLLVPGAIENSPDHVQIQNPFGVHVLGSVPKVVGGFATLAILLAAAPALAAVVLRYRRSRGEERQQIRWLAYLAATIGALILIGIAFGLALGDAFGNSIYSAILFYAVFALIGLGVPSTMGIAVLKYRLYDLDLVVQKTVLYAIVAVLLTAVFLVAALAIGAIAGRGQAGAIVAAALIGLLFWPSARLARRIADRLVYGGRATPYEVLAEFSARVGGSYGAEDVLPRMAQILAGAVGARQAIVWLRVGAELRPAAVEPDAEAPDPVRLSGDDLPRLPADGAVEVRDRGELLGALTVSTPPNDPMNPSKERLVRDLASQAGLVLRNVSLIEELRESRRRIVAAQDERARKLERNIHDGAQQQLVALAVKLRLAEQLAERDPAKAKEMLAQLQGETTEALENLRDLARGIYPPLLADAGLVPAVEAQARKSPVPVDVASEVIDRYPREVEAAVYFCVLEAMQNLAKYSQAKGARISLGQSDGDLMFAIEDDGVGFDPASAHGTGLPNMRDRLEALGGKVEVRSSVGAGTKVTGRIPVRALEATPS